ncbi:MAG: hypothetical protein ACI3XM_04535 [Eubacteriales bacterium]
MKKFQMVFLFVSVLLLATGCRTGQPESTNTTEGTAAEPPETDLYEYHRGMDYGGREVTILIRQEFEKEFYIEQTTGEVVDDAVYHRNRMTEELLDIELNYTSVPGSFSNQSIFKKAFTDSVLAKDGAYDLVASAANYMLPLAAEGYFQNLMTCPGVQIEEPWYAQNYIDSMSIKGKLYLVAGSASINFLQNMCVVFFNQNLMNDLSYSYPYEDVRNGDWTFDSLNQLVKDSGADINGDGTIDLSDRLGWLTYGNMVNAQIVGMGHHYIERDANDIPYVIDTLGERSVSVYERVEHFINGLDGVLYYIDKDQDALKATQNLLKTWETGNTLFFPQVLSTAEQMRDQSFDFGILPFPKSDTDQEAYQTFLLENVTVLGIPQTADIECSGRVLDVLSINGYYDLSSVYYDIALKEKYSRDTDTKDMLDIIRSSVVFEYPLATQFMANCIQAQKPIISAYESQKKVMISEFYKIVEAYEDLD